MESVDAINALANFLKQVSGQNIESTSATVTSYAGALYNVDGSTADPKINGLTWKQLLIGAGINADCYVTNPGAGGSHPSFSVGGHMTTNPDGSVPTGGTCYLMPLCFFHNSTSQNSIAFAHTNTAMLLLSGYMTSDIAATFVARMPSASPFSIVYLSGKGLETQNVAESSITDASTLKLPNVSVGKLPENYILFRQKVQDSRISYVIEKANLPG